MFTHGQRRLAKTLGVTPEALPAALKKEEQRRQAEERFYQWGKDQQKKNGKK